MGVRLVGAALNQDWTRLSDRAFRILVRMAYTAKDTATNGHAPATYWGGQEPFILSVLGQDPDQLSEAEYATAARKIKRAFQELKEAGAIALVSSAARGRTAVYRLTLAPWADSLPVDNSEPEPPAPKKRGALSTPQSDHVAPPISSEWGALGGRNGGRSAPPRGEHIGEQEERGEIEDPTQPPAELWSAASPNLWITQ